MTICENQWTLLQEGECWTQKHQISADVLSLILVYMNGQISQ